MTPRKPMEITSLDQDMRQKMMSHDMKVNRATVKVPLQSRLGFYWCLCLNVWASLCRTMCHRCFHIHCSTCDLWHHKHSGSWAWFHLHRGWWGEEWAERWRRRSLCRVVTPTHMCIIGRRILTRQQSVRRRSITITRLVFHLDSRYFKTGLEDILKIKGVKEKGQKHKHSSWGFNPTECPRRGILWRQSSHMTRGCIPRKQYVYTLNHGTVKHWLSGRTNETSLLGRGPNIHASKRETTFLPRRCDKEKLSLFPLFTWPRTFTSSHCSLNLPL